MSESPQEQPPKQAAHGAVGNVTSLAGARAAARSKKPTPSPATESDDEDEGHNPLAVALGAAVILALVICAWLLIDSMKCNPMFSDAGLYHSRACR